MSDPEPENEFPSSSEKSQEELIEFIRLVSQSGTTPRVEMWGEAAFYAKIGRVAPSGNPGDILRRSPVVQFSIDVFLQYRGDVIPQTKALGDVILAAGEVMRIPLEVMYPNKKEKRSLKTSKGVKNVIKVHELPDLVVMCAETLKPRFGIILQNNRDLKHPEDQIGNVLTQMQYTQQPFCGLFCTNLFLIPVLHDKAFKALVTAGSLEDAIWHLLFISQPYA